MNFSLNKLINKPINLEIGFHPNQTLRKAIVFGTVTVPGDNLDIHDQGVVDYFLGEYEAPGCGPEWDCKRIVIGQGGTIYGSIIHTVSTLAEGIAYAASIGAEILMFSYGGTSTDLEWDNAYEQGMIAVLPHFGNTFVEVKIVTDSIRSSAILCGATWEGGSKDNMKSYGQGIEFYDSLEYSAAESYTAAIIAAKLARIMSLGYNRDEARQILRQISSEYPNYSTLNGYGIPDMSLVPLQTIIDVAVPCDIDYNVSGDTLIVNFTPNGEYDHVNVIIDEVPLANDVLTYVNESGVSTDVQVKLVKTLNNEVSADDYYVKRIVRLSSFKIVSVVAVSSEEIIVTLSKPMDINGTSLVGFSSNDLNILTRNKIDSTHIKFIIDGTMSAYMPCSIYYDPLNGEVISSYAEALEQIERMDINVDISGLAELGDPSFTSAEVLSVGSTNATIRTVVNIAEHEEAILTVYFGIGNYSSNFEPVTITASGQFDLESGLIVLTPGTLYQYRVLIQAGFSELFSTPGTFTTNT